MNSGKEPENEPDGLGRFGHLPLQDLGALGGQQETADGDPEL